MHEARYLLTGVEFEVLWVELMGGAPPPVLRLDSPGRTHRQRAHIQAAAWRALRDRGLADATGPDAGLVRLLRSLAQPTEQLELRAHWGAPMRAVAATRDGAAEHGHPTTGPGAGWYGTGALAVRQGDSVLVTDCGSLPTALLGTLPPGRPGPGPAASLPTSVLATALAAPALVPALVAGQVPRSEARLLDRMLGGVERQAQVVALAAGPPDGVLRRRGGVIRVLEGPSGRYVVTRATGPDGTDWATVAPAHPRRLRQRVGELLPPRPAHHRRVGREGRSCSAHS